MSNEPQLGRPQGATIRQAPALVPNEQYKIDYLYQELSKFEDFVTKKFPLKTIAVYQDVGLTFYTYLCKDYDEKPESFIQETNQKIKNGDNVRLVYYGTIGKYHYTRILFDGEGLDKKITKSMSAIAKANATKFVMKRRHDEDNDNEDEDSPSPKKGNKS